ncbi:helix-turn-helix domain-containing protein [Chryseobacterium joostei]|uniref:helix-turn-helix domain-containing protein n=1 Tax=Chryseobacterium joostei TaxID=112234 RepID=UPI003C6C1B51
MLDYFKELSNAKEQYGYRVPFTRQQIANLTGLRVETVIRLIKKMERQKIVKLKQHQIFY